MNTYQFIKEPTGWYIDLPEYILQGGTKEGLQMVEGADVMLDIIAEGRDKVILDIDLHALPGSTTLLLVEKCDPYIGGGFYLLEEWNGKKVGMKMWLCEVTEWLFGHLPAAIHIKEVATE
ncbi:hypothetical protein LZZ85_16595 [Terrimonas sp. NA20]|uniref:Uncharacterized protein n=1 Tax=Terrimonas ginsenosidimutans TaxID=2908004 RepID=A0ABS9KUD7_9BACT|nr:DUF6717 family protein [Terrimonas ginsenosidimutans]MCG2615917.1 hypothetical protein [Terrimonas ginsenosidimutans]